MGISSILLGAVLLHGMMAAATNAGAPNPCLSSPCKWGSCRPTPGQKTPYMCVCPKGFSGRRCEVLPIPSACGFHVKGELNFQAKFRSAHRQVSDDAEYRDTCTSSRLVLATEVDSFCARDYYMAVSQAFANEGSFAYISAMGPVYVHVSNNGAMNVTKFSYSDNLAGLIRYQRRTGFPLIQICATPRHSNGLVGIPYSLPDSMGGDTTCDQFGLKRHLYQGYNKIRMSMAALIDSYASALPTGPLYFYMDVHSAQKDRYARVFKFVRTHSHDGLAYGRMVLSRHSPPDVTINMAICDRVNFCDGNPCGVHSIGCHTMVIGYACFCKNGFTGRNCEKDTAALRATCGQRTLYVAGHTITSTQHALTVSNAFRTCAKHYADLPSESLTKCERNFFDNVSRMFFSHKRYLYFSTADQDVSDASLKKQIRAVFRNHPVSQAIICQGIIINSQLY